MKRRFMQPCCWTLGFICLFTFLNFSQAAFAISPGLEDVEALRHPDDPFASSPDILTLEDCLSIGLKENRLLKQSDNRVKIARTKKEQLVATQFPTAQVRVSQSHLNPQPSSAFGQQDSQQLSISESFDPFGKFRSQKRAVNASLIAAQAAHTDDTIDTAFQITEAFYNVILAVELRRVASESVDQLTQHRDNTKSLVDAGTAPDIDLIRAEVQLAVGQTTLIKARHAISNFAAGLYDLIGLDPNSRARIIGSFPELIPPNLPLDEPKAVYTAFSQRSDIKAARSVVEAARCSLAARRKELQPSVEISQQFQRTRGAKSPLREYLNNNTVDMGLVFPVFDSGLTKAQTREASLNLDQAKLSYDQTLSALHVEIRNSISALTESFQVLVAQEKNVEQAQRALNIAEKAYRTGAKTSLDVLDAQVALTQARTLRFQALRDRAVALAQFERSLGVMPGYFFSDISCSPSGEKVPLRMESASPDKPSKP
ncbi:MAG: TolC family protein [Candidatus Riflebacteria bacterium]|nr:TolC family protein [Candidatus Riflebacteria bacterium]